MLIWRSSARSRRVLIRGVIAFPDRLSHYLCGSGPAACTGLPYPGKYSQPLDQS